MPQSSDPRTDHLAHAVGQGHLIQGTRCRPPPRRVLVDGPGLRQVAQHLAHEERVTVGLAMHGMGEAHRGVVEGVPSGGLQQRHHAGVIEPGQVDAGDAALSMQCGQGVEQRVGL